MTFGARPLLRAYIDESGQRGHSPRSSKHFVMTATIMLDSRVAHVAAWTAQLRKDLGRRPGDTLHFVNLKSHAERVHAAKALGKNTDLAFISVVVCKDHLTHATRLSDDQAYLFTFRFLLERLSWFARDRKHDLTYTLAHIRRFKLSQLRQYEAALRASSTSVAWDYLDPSGGTIDQPSRDERLQIADIGASATAQAFEPDRFGNTEDRYLREMLPRVWARGNGANRLTTYGLKMHPWSASTKAAYPWVATL